MLRALVVAVSDVVVCDVKSLFVLVEKYTNVDVSVVIASISDVVDGLFNVWILIVD